MLYHRDIYFPPDLKLPQGIFPLRFGSHAKRAALERSLYIPASLDTRKCEVIEVEKNDTGKIQKIVFRLGLTNEADLCIAVATDKYPWFVKSVWRNNASDKHVTLNKVRYVQQA